MILCISVTYRNARKAATVLKRMRADACYSVSDCYARKTVTAVERIIADALNAIGNYKLCNKLTVQVQILCIIKRIVIITTKRNLAPFCYICNMNARKSATASERIRADSCYTIGNCHARKAATVIERFRTYTLNAVRNNYTRKIITITENLESPLALAAAVVLKQYVNRETDKWNAQGTTSTTSLCVIFHALQAALIEETGYRAEQFALIHPGGAVGERLNNKSV